MKGKTILSSQEGESQNCRTARPVYYEMRDCVQIKIHYWSHLLYYCCAFKGKNTLGILMGIYRIIDKWRKILGLQFIH